MARGAYLEAIKPLKKDFYGESRNVNAGVLLAKCYYKLRDYQEAADVFTQIDPQEMENADDRRFLADVFIVNNDYSGAYLELIQLFSENQSDEKTYLWLDKVSDLMKWDSISNYSSTDIVKGINTIYNEYAPYLSSNSELWFVSDVSGIQTVFPNSFNTNNLHLYYKTKLKGSSENTVSRPSMLFKNRDYYYHDGPIAKWKDEQYALTLRDIDAPNGILGIYFSSLVGTEEDMVPFKYNEKYNTGHATFANAGNRLIFTSDRPGGYGEMDLWYCDFINGDWTTPKNMGPVINTPYNEVFPTYFKGRLYYSSDRQDIGYGALDVYYSSEKEGYNNVTNLQAPINSAYDDFGITLANTIEGFYSSNRNNGFGGDDIYSFSFRPEKISIKQTNYEFISGTVPEGSLVQILNENDSLIATARTSKDGKFQVNDLETSQNYKIKLADPTISKDVRVKLLSESGSEVNEFAQASNQEFKFELTGIDETNTTAYASETEKMSHAIIGKLIATKGTQINGIPVLLKSLAGKEVGNSKTDSEGKFSIPNVPIGEEFTIETSGLDTAHEIDIYGSSGAITQSLSPIGSNSFSYTRAAAPAAWMDASQIAVDNVFGVILNSEVLAGKTVTVYDDKDEVVLSPIIDEDGFMKLGTLNTGRAYRINMPNGNLTTQDRLILLDGNGDTSQTVRPFDADNYFFEYLIYKDYGAPDAEIDMMAKSKDVPKNNAKRRNYKAVIKDYDLAKESAFILRSSDGTYQDTVYCSNKGIILLDDVDPDKIYEIVMMEGTLMKNKMLQLFDNDNNLIFSALSTEFRIFKLGSLRDMDHSLPAVADSNPVEFTANIMDGLEDDATKNLTGFQNESLGKSYKARIDGFDLPTKTAFELKSLDGLRTDTIYSNSSGVLVMDNLHEELEYELTLIDTTFADNKNITLFNDSYKYLLESESVDNNKFRFSLLKSDDKSLSAIENNNFSVLKINLAGQIESKDGSKAQITVYDTKNKELGMAYSTATSNFVVKDLSPNSNYVVTSTSTDPNAVLVLDIPDRKTALRVERNADGNFYVNMNAENKPEITLADNKQEVKVQQGARFSLPSVYYAFNSYYLKLEAKKSLEGLIALLKENPELRIEIQSHTDSRGPANYNNLLSQRRANGVAEYLQSVGISQLRLVAVGKGETELSNKCADGVNCTENEHAKNRRTEFLILGNETAEE